MDKFKRKSGFTLLEVIIVIAIVGILMGFIYLILYSQIVKAKDAERKIDLETIASSVEQYYEDQKYFPVTLPACGQPLTAGSKVYLPAVPCDPNGQPYGYSVDNNNPTRSQEYKLLAFLENSDDSSIDKVGCRYGCGDTCSYNYGISSENIPVTEGCPFEYIEWLNQPPGPTNIPGNTPTPTPTPPAAPYVCAPGGDCEIFAFPEESQCPAVYFDDETCQNACGTKANRCHDSRGRR